MERVKKGVFSLKFSYAERKGFDCGSGGPSGGIGNIVWEIMGTKRYNKGARINRIAPTTATFVRNNFVEVP